MRIPLARGHEVEALYYVVLILPPLSLLYYISRFGVNVIHLDEFDTVVDIRKFMNGTLSLSELFAQHNEHRILFPRLIIIANALLFHYNTIVEMYLSWLLISLTFIVLLAVYRANGKSLLVFLPVSFLLFSLRQSEGILWGFEFQVYLMIFSAVSAIFLLLKGESNVRFSLGIVSAIVSTFSFATGLVVWPVGLMHMILSSGTEKLHTKEVTWGILGTLTGALYFVGYTNPSGTSPVSDLIAHPLRYFLYFLALLGTPFNVSSRSAAVTFGSVICLVALIVIVQVYRSSLMQRNRFFISIVLFSALSALVITFGRAELGIAQASSPGYTAITLLGLSGLYLLAVSVHDRLPGNSKSFGFHVLLALILIAIIVSAHVGWQTGQIVRNQRLNEACILQTYKTQPDYTISRYLYPNATFVRAQALFLQQRKLNVFSTPSLLNTSCPQLSNSDIVQPSSCAGCLAETTIHLIQTLIYEGEQKATLLSIYASNFSV